VHTGRILGEAQWVCEEGEVSNHLLVPRDPSQSLRAGNSAPLPIPGGFSIRLLDFDEVNYPRSDIPADYSSWIEIREPGNSSGSGVGNRGDGNGSGGRRIERVRMDHRVRIGDLYFHQSARIPLDEVERWNFEVRREVPGAGKDGARVGVADAGRNCPAPIPDTDLLLEVSGGEAGGRWTIAKIQNPDQPIASGIIEPGIIPAHSGDNHDAPPPGPAESGGAKPVLVRDAAANTPPSGGWRVIAMGPAQGYATILSVAQINPALWMIWVGVGLILAGVVSTFTIRHRHIFGLWDAEGRRLRLAMIPHRSSEEIAQADFRHLLEIAHRAGAREVKAEKEEDKQIHLEAEAE